MKNAIILVSGGLDSVVSAYYVKEKLKYKNIKFLFFDYGHRARKEEEFCSRKIAKNLNVEFIKIDIAWLGNLSTSFINKKGKIPITKEKDIESGNKDFINWWVPCRNSIFLVNSLAIAESEFLKNKKRYDVFIGLKNEGRVFMKDTTPKFVKKINELAEESTNDGGFKVLAPLIKMDKPEVINIGNELNVPFEITYSCYIGNGFSTKIPKHCGQCLNCMLRKKGFYWAGVKDPSLYIKK